jgi:hypothetical protein
MISTSRLALAAILLACTAACGGEPPPPPATPPPPAPEPPPPPPPAPTASAPAKPEVEWKTMYDFADKNEPRTAQPDDKKIIALVTDIKKAHKECANATPTISSQSDKQGSFTAKNVKESAWVVEWDCNAKGAAQKDKKRELVFHRLVVTAADDKGAPKLTREVDIAEKRIAGVSDVDSDGDNELVLVSGWSSKIEARLVELADAGAGQVAVIFTWPDLGDSECVNGSQDVPKLMYRMTDSPEYKAEHAKRTCTAPTTTTTTGATTTPPPKK